MIACLLLKHKLTVPSRVSLTCIDTSDSLEMLYKVDLHRLYPTDCYRKLQNPLGQLTASLGANLVFYPSPCVWQSLGLPCVTPDTEAGWKAVQYLLRIQSCWHGGKANLTVYKVMLPAFGLQLEAGHSKLWWTQPQWFLCLFSVPGSYSEREPTAHCS